MLRGVSFFFFNDTATTEIYTLSLHDALPISGDDLDGLPDRVVHRGLDLLARLGGCLARLQEPVDLRARERGRLLAGAHDRSEEHTSELQSRQYLVCRLLLEKKTTNISSVSSS